MPVWLCINYLVLRPGSISGLYICTIRDLRPGSISGVYMYMYMLIITVGHIYFVALVDSQLYIEFSSLS